MIFQWLWPKEAFTQFSKGCIPWTTTSKAKQETTVCVYGTQLGAGWMHMVHILAIQLLDLVHYGRNEYTQSVWSWQCEMCNHTCMISFRVEWLQRKWNCHGGCAWDTGAGTRMCKIYNSVLHTQSLFKKVLEQSLNRSQHKEWQASVLANRVFKGMKELMCVCILSLQKRNIHSHSKKHLNVLS